MRSRPRPTCVSASFRLAFLLCLATCTPETTDPGLVIAGVSISPASSQLTALGATRQLTATATTPVGQAVTGAIYTWSSSSSAATVDAAGLVTAVGNGTATITATTAGVSGSAAVVVAQSVQAVSVTPSSPTIEALDGTLQVAASATDSRGNPVSGQTATWTSSDPSIATVSNSGLVTAVANGSAEVTASVAGITAATTVTVAQVAATLVTAPLSDTIDGAGQAVQVSFAAVDANGHDIVSPVATWSTSDATVATVNDQGLVVAQGVGTADITVMVDDLSAVTEILVRDIASLVINENTPGNFDGAFFNLTDPIQLTATALTSDGDTIQDPSVDWTSSHPENASVDENGLVMPLAHFRQDTAEPLVAITASSGALTDTWHAEIAIRVDSVVIEAESMTLEGAGATLDLTAKAYDPKGNLVVVYPEPTGPDWGTSFIWTTSDSALATVAPTSGTSFGPVGRVTATGTGTVMIIASHNSASNAITLDFPADTVTLTIDVGLSITTSELPNGTVGQDYGTQNLAATGGDGSFAWSLSSGTLPPGLSLSGAGAITGTPTDAGTFEFTVEVTSGGVTGTKALAIVVEAPALADLMIHRWKFDEDRKTVLVDDIGGANATIVEVGSHNARAQGGAVLLAGGARDSADYVALPADLLEGRTDVTIEFWATPLSVHDFSRMFEIGSVLDETLAMLWSRVGPETNRVLWRKVGANLEIDDTMGPDNLGVESHFALTVDGGGGTGGTALVTWYRDGQAKGSFEFPGGLSDLDDDVFHIGHSGPRNTLSANAAYNEFRIYETVLTASQILESFGSPPPPAAFGKLEHRWRFNEEGGQNTTLVDDVAGANGFIQGAGSVTGGSAVTGAGYVVMPWASVLGGRKDLTIELWATQNSVSNWGHVFSVLGTEASSGGSIWLAMSWSNATDINNDRVEWAQLSPTAGNAVDGSMAPYTLGQQHHIVLTIQNLAGTGGDTVVRWYLNGVFRGSFESDFVLGNFGVYNSINSGLGKSWSGTHSLANASYNEMRVYSRALSPGEIAANTASGPGS